MQGGDRYVVSVWLSRQEERDKIESHCTCPVGYNCKHAVATVAAYLQALTDGPPFPRPTKTIRDGTSSRAPTRSSRTTWTIGTTTMTRKTTRPEIQSEATETSPATLKQNAQRLGRQDQAAYPRQEPRGIGRSGPLARRARSRVAGGVSGTDRHERRRRGPVGGPGAAGNAGPHGGNRLAEPLAGRGPYARLQPAEAPAGAAGGTRPCRRGRGTGARVHQAGDGSGRSNPTTRAKRRWRWPSACPWCSTPS